MRNEEMLETSIRVAGHEVENILPSAMNFLSKIKKMSTMDLLEYIPSGKYDNKMEDLEDQLELIKNIYDRPRLIFKEFKLKKTLTSLSFLLTRMAILFRNHADLRKMSIPAPDAFFNTIDINADKDLISHVFYNLLDNAVKYGYKGTNIHIKGEEKNGKLIIRIISYGSKIEDDSLIYALYYRGNNQKNRAEGLGIGMFVSKRIVDGHRFSIKHSSEKVNDENLPVKLSQIFRDTKTDWREYEDYKEIMAINENNELKYQPRTIDTETTLSFSTHKNTFWIEIPDYGYKLKNN
jgi:K+-sensing histidine kinase KdpD